jgi:hypothetical protein
MQQHGYRPSTIKATVKTLKTLSRRCNLANPTDVKTNLATHPYTENRKFKIINDISWERPRSRRIETLPFLPTEDEIVGRDYLPSERLRRGHLDGHRGGVVFT